MSTETATAETATAARSRAAHLGPERRRPQILDTALSLAVEQGFAAVTVAALASEMGVTRPVIYACFTDRVELLGALLDREQAAMTEDMLDALHTSGGATTPEEAFVVGATSLLSVVGKRPDSWRLILQGEPDPALSQRLSQTRAVITGAATAWIRPAMIRWWQTDDLDRKLPILIELFMSSCEAGVRTLLDPDNDWGADELGDFLGRALHRMFESA